MKYIKIVCIAILFASISFVGCDKGFEELNKNPNEPTSIPANLMIPDAVFNTANSLYSTFWGGDMGACWSQQWTKVQYNDEERYVPRESVIEGTVWKSLYEDCISDSRTMYNLAVTEENPNLQGIAKTIESLGFLVLADAFGDIPYTEALNSEILKPKYDPQEVVYDGAMASLDEAIALFGSGPVDASPDIIYGGDVSKWKKFASSLKFRALMRISGKRDVSADLQALVNAGNLFSSNADNAGVQYLAANPNANPIYETIVFGTRNEWKINSKMVEKLQDFSDPRLTVYAQKNGSGEYRGKPAGIAAVPNDDYNYDNVSPLGEFFLNPELPGTFLTYSEMCFLRAEAAFKGYTSEDAETLYTQGIEASFTNVGLTSGQAADYMSSGGVTYNPGNALQQIGEQNWIGLFGQGFEAWTEWRRTGFPALSPAADPSPTVSGIPTRYTYPAIEQSVNKENFDAAAAAMGGNKLDSKVWWMN